MFQKLVIILMFSSSSIQMLAQKDSSSQKPLRVGIVGLVHTHVHGILGREKKGDIEIVGIAEPNRQLAEAYTSKYGISMNIVFSSMEEMINKTKPDAVLAFNTIFDHLKVVEFCAPRHLPVMVEKPLAVNMEHANKMLALADQYGIPLLTNYETTWYGSNEKAYQLINEQKAVGELRKLVFHTGHNGPIEIGCNKEFLDWLTDPVLNGGGALSDFGCYGADITTWLMEGEHPETITAVTQQIKPQLYPKVEDEATLILKFKKAQVIIQASWNWPFSRKDMEVYGLNGYIFCKDGTNMLLKINEKTPPEALIAPALPADRNDPFVYFKNVVQGKIILKKFDLSAPATNRIVMQILEAAKLSAKTGRTIVWDELYKE